MRKSVVCIVLVSSCLLCNTNFAQSISVGAKGGISIPNLTAGGSANPLSRGYQSSLGANAALYGEYSFSNLFSVELSAEYSAQGGKKHGKQALPVTAAIAALFPPNQAPPYLWTNFNADAKLDYLLVPLLAKVGFDIGNHSAWRVYASAGPFAGFLLRATTITSGSDNVYADEAETQPLLTGPVSFDSIANVKDQLKNFNWGIEANIGLAYHFQQHSIFIEGGGNYGFIPIQKLKEDGQNHTGAASVRIGYAFTFGSVNHARRSVKSPKVFN